MKRSAKYQASKDSFFDDDGRDVSDDDQDSTTERQRPTTERTFSVPRRSYGNLPETDSSSAMKNPFAKLQTSHAHDNGSSPAGAILPKPNASFVVDSTSQASMQRQRDQLVAEIRTLNAKFQAAVHASLERDPAADLIGLFQQYSVHRQLLQSRFENVRDAYRSLFLPPFQKPAEHVPAKDEKPVAFATSSTKAPEPAPIFIATAKPADVTPSAKALESTPAAFPSKESAAPAFTPFTFGKGPATNESKPAASFASSPAFSFTKPSEPSSIPSSAPPSHFSAPKPTEAPSIAQSTPTFTFTAPKPAEPSPQTTSPPVFSFAAKSTDSTNTGSAFSFAPKSDEKVSERPPFSFGTSSTPALEGSQPTTQSSADTKSAFALGSAQATSGSDSKPTFTFGNTSANSAAKPAAAPSQPPSFSFTPNVNAPAFTASTGLAPAFTFSNITSTSKPVFDFGKDDKTGESKVLQSSVDTSEDKGKPPQLAAQPSESIAKPPVFQFGATVPIAAPDKNADSKPAAFSFGSAPALPAFSFGAAGPFGSQGGASTFFGGGSANPFVAVSKKSDDEGGEDDEGNVQEQEETPTDKTLLERGAGEEEEETVLSYRCKLFCRAGEAWQDQGVGLCKINARRDDRSKRRLLMRSEGTGKVLLNANAQGGVLAKPAPSGKATEIVLVVPSADAATAPLTYLLRAKEELGALLTHLQQ